MNIPIHIPVGTKVAITEETLQTIINSSKSILVYPSQSFVDLCKSLVGVTGTVTRDFLPGYDINVTFNEKTLHMKDTWVQVLEAN